MYENYEYHENIAGGGLTHIHTEMSSDAVLSLGEIGEYTRDHLRSEYFVVNDHLTSPYREKGYSGPEVAEIIEEMLKKVDEYNGSHDRPKCISGVETNIITDGVDIPDALLERIDFVIASRHHPWGNEDVSQITHNLVAAMENPSIDAIGHITNYIDMPIDWDLIFQTAEKTNTFIEINFGTPPSREILDIMSKYNLIYTLGLDFHTFQGFKHRLPINSDVITDFAEAKKMAKSLTQEAAELKQEYAREPVGFGTLKRLVILMRQLEGSGINTNRIVNARNLDSFINIIKTPKSQRNL